MLLVVSSSCGSATPRATPPEAIVAGHPSTPSGNSRSCRSNALVTTVAGPRGTTVRSVSTYKEKLFYSGGWESSDASGHTVDAGFVRAVVPARPAETATLWEGPAIAFNVTASQ